MWCIEWILVYDQLSYAHSFIQMVCSSSVISIESLLKMTMFHNSNAHSTFRIGIFYEFDQCKRMLKNTSSFYISAKWHDHIMWTYQRFCIHQWPGFSGSHCFYVVLRLWNMMVVLLLRNDHHMHKQQLWIVELRNFAIRIYQLRVPFVYVNFGLRNSIMHVKQLSLCNRLDWIIAHLFTIWSKWCRK